MSEIKDSGNRREFSTGAVRDMAEGKGRCDLLPLDVISDLFVELKCEKYERVNIVLNYLNAALKIWKDEALSWDSVRMDFVVGHLYNALKEFLGCRADDNVNRLQLYKQIAQYGYCQLAQVETELKNKTTLNTIDTFLLGAGIKSDLITDGLMLQRTLDAKKVRQSTADRKDQIN